MVEIELDGQKVEVNEGSMIMHAAEKAGTFIPHFCYHKKLSIAASCRMCLVDVEKAPKPMPACATPVTQGMIVKTKSDRALKAQQSVMEFLLVNHPLDCPICDQGGECQLQDLAVGYGGSVSRYEEEKRVVAPKNAGPLISMEEMSRCIHCTRCVRFGQEVAGVMELGMIHRGEHAEITTVLGDTIDSELSGNMIDICPVGALTSKPFRYSARTWELSRRKSISPHDSTGANLIVQVKNNKVMRVVPLENEAINECWIADRDRFSYEALNGEERLTSPMIKQGGAWQEVDWQTALEYVANGLKQIKSDYGAQSIGTLASPHCTVEELYLAASLMRGLGSDNIDHRLRHAEFALSDKVRWLGTSIASLSSLDRVLVLGSHLRKDHPLFAQRIRQAVKKGAQVSRIHHVENDWAMPIAHQQICPSGQWLQALADIASVIATEKNVTPPTKGKATESASRIAKMLLNGERKAVLLGNAAAHHIKASSLLSLAGWIASQTGASIGYLTEAANTVGAQLVRAMPTAKNTEGTEGFNATQMLSGSLKAVLLLNTEPKTDSAAAVSGLLDLSAAQMVVSLSPFKANMDVSDVLLPIAPFTETSGSFVNAEGRLQSFHAVVKPLAQTRPAWKVLRVLGNTLGLPSFSFETSQEVLAKALTSDAYQQQQNNQPNQSNQSNLQNLQQICTTYIASRLDNACQTNIHLQVDAAVPVVADIYQLDGIVRRAPSLQLTADAKRFAKAQAATAKESSNG